MQIKIKECISFHNPLSSSLLSKNINCKIYWNVILRFVLERRGTCCPTLREEHRSRKIRKRVYKRRLKI
jgi:hypothetical protein